MLRNRSLPPLSICARNAGIVGRPVPIASKLAMSEVRNTVLPERDNPVIATLIGRSLIRLSSDVQSWPAELQNAAQLWIAVSADQIVGDRAAGRGAAAINDILRTRDVGGEIGTQELHEVRDLLGGAVAADRNVLLIPRSDAGRDRRGSTSTPANGSFAYRSVLGKPRSPAHRIARPRRRRFWSGRSPRVSTPRKPASQARPPDRRPRRCSPSRRGPV